MGSAPRGTSAQHRAEEDEEEGGIANVNLFAPFVGGTEELVITESEIEAYSALKLARTHTQSPNFNTLSPMNQKVSINDDDQSH